MSSSSPIGSAVFRRPRTIGQRRLEAVDIRGMRRAAEDLEAHIEQTRQTALAQGRAEGEAAVRAEIGTELEETLSHLRAQAEELTTAHRSFLAGAEEEVLAVCLALVRRILAVETARDDSVDRESLSRILYEIADRKEVSVRISPDAVEQFERLEGALGRQVTAPAGIRWIPDRRVPRWGVVVETEAGKIDARVETQLEEAAALFAEVFGDRND